MRVLVTGGTGFVGSAIVKELLKHHHQIRVLVRKTSDRSKLIDSNIEFVEGDVLDKDSLKEALKGCQMVYHAAAVYDHWVPDKKLIGKTAIDGTRNLLESVLGSNVEKVVYTSSSITIGERKGEIGNEHTKHRGYFTSIYEQAKYEAEQVAMSYVAKGLPLVCVNPASVYGPGDLKPSGRAAIDCLNGKVPFILAPDSLISLVYIDDVARGHLLAAEKGKIGERYILSGGRLTTREWIEKLCNLAGVQSPRWVMPNGVAYLLAHFGEAISRINQKPPLIAKDTVTTIKNGNAVDGSKAEKDLGLVYTSFETGFINQINWYWENGYLKKKPKCFQC